MKKYIRSLLIKRGWNKLAFPPALNLDSHFYNSLKYLKLKNSPDELKLLNIGAGRFRLNGWTNVDLKVGSLSENWKNEDINHDLTKNIPISLPDNSVKAIYASHVIEHIFEENVNFLFTDCFRLLETGGVLRIVCPDINLAERAYQDNDELFFKEIYGDEITSNEKSLVRYFATQLINNSSNSMENSKIVSVLKSDLTREEKLNFFTENCSKEVHKENPDDHVNWFDEAKLIKLLSNAGFKNINKSRFGQSSISVLRDTRHFDSTLPHMSLYIEAIK
mgnify:FL=1